MNILLLTTSYPADAADANGVFIHSLARALVRRGHAVRVVVPGRSDALGRGELDGVAVRRFRYALTARGHRLTSVEGGIPEALRRSRLAALQIPALMTAFAAAALSEARWADVVFANWLGAGVAGSVANCLGRVPMVLTLRGDDAYLIHDRPWWRRAGRWVFRHCKAVTVVSGNMVAQVEEFVPERIRPVIVPTFGVDIERFRPATEAEGAAASGHRGDPQTAVCRHATPEHERPCGVFVGNVSRAKGVDVLLRALAARREDWGRFTFVGGGPDLAAMQQLAGELGLAERIEWRGRTPPAAMPEVLRRYDFLVLPSLSEGRPNVVLEALASALPVIATRVGGTADLVEEGRTGLLVPPGDVAALAEALRRLGTDGDLRRRMALGARAFVEEKNLTWDRTAAEFEAIFRRAVGITS